MTGNPVASVPNMPKLELDHDLMHVLIIYRFNKITIKIKWVRPRTGQYDITLERNDSSIFSGAILPKFKLDRVFVFGPRLSVFSFVINPMGQRELVAS